MKFVNLLTPFLLLCSFFLIWFVRLHQQERDNEPAKAGKQESSRTLESPVINPWPKANQTWTNSLGQTFVPAGTYGVLFCVYDVRVKDYQKFVTATGRKWPKPDFGNYVQSENDPAVYVSWDDAQAFCNWLTKKDHEEGLLGPNQSYRLPKDDEWTRAVGPGKYPWGDSSSPPLEAGNYCRQGDSSSFDYTSFRGTDGYAYTSPVGKFKPNSYGLYDMGGNVYQWCDDWYTASLNNDEVKTQDKELANDAGGHMYKVLRGSSWGKGGPEYLLSATRCFDIPTTYNLSGDVGFRIVVVISR